MDKAVQTMIENFKKNTGKTLEQINVTDQKGITKEVIDWLKKAYQAAG